MEQGMSSNGHRRRRSTAAATLVVATLGLAAGLAPAAVAIQNDDQQQESDDAPRGPRGGHPELTDEQKTCLEGQGVQKPAKDENGERVRPTEEQREAFRAAAEACGIELPERPAHAPQDTPRDAPEDAPDNADDTADSTAV
jgi:hypothetical protein